MGITVQMICDMAVGAGRQIHESTEMMGAHFGQGMFANVLDESDRNIRLGCAQRIIVQVKWQMGPLTVVCSAAYGYEHYSHVVSASV
jgi:hypothetical protein